MNPLFDQILEAHEALRPQVAVTPLTLNATLSEMTGCEVYMKCEHLQHTGSFKFRGATNKLRKLGRDVASQGMITASTGNHGQALALASRRLGVPLTVYAAATTAEPKLAAIRAQGAELITLALPPLEVEMEARRQAGLQGRPFVPPYNDLDVIAGQGTLGAEIVDQLPDLDAAFISVGGGGLMSGVGTAIKGLRPQAQLVGVWPENSTCLHQSMQVGRIIETEDLPTLSDGTAGGVEPGSVTLEICQKVIDRSVLVSEAEIAQAMRLVAQTDRWIVEGAAGVALAGLLKTADQHRGGKVVVLLCGRNIALETFLKAVA